jgi:hypothetical protein
MPFLLDGNPSQGELSEAVNYLLSNFTQSVAADPNTGQVIGPGGEIQYYLYKYMFVKYADSFDGSVGFSDTPTNKSYYGLRNSDSSTESTNPADYVWTQVSGGFGTTKFLYYLTTGGRAIQFQVATSVPNPGWVLDSGAAIDLDVTLATNSVANFVIIRLANNSSAPTNAECITAIGRTPIAGDLCTINYNSGIASIVYKYTTGWAIFQKYITGDLIVANSIIGNNIAAGTITADKLFSTYIQVGGAAGDVNSGVTTINGGKITANSITADKLTASYIQVGGAASDVNSGVTTISGGKITANSIAADRLSVSQLSAINANLGSITAGSLDAVSVTGSTLTIGSSPAISGNTMTGSGAKVYSDGRFAFGNSSSNVVFNGTAANINGFVQQSTSTTASTNIVIGSTPPTILTFSSTKNNANLIGFTGGIILTVPATSIAITPNQIAYDLYFYLYTTSGTFIQQFYTSYRLPVVLTGTEYTNIFAFNLFVVTTLAADSYKLLCGNTQYPLYYNAAGSAAYATSTSTHYIQGFTSQYQATV